MRLRLTVLALLLRTTFMAVGLSQANLLHPWLNTMRGGGNGANFTAPAVIAAQMHTADPGASGTNAAAANLGGRQAASFNAAGSNQIALSATVSWSATGAETLTHVAFFNQVAAGGTFYWSAALTASRTVANGDTLSLTSATLGLSPAAA